MVHNADGSVAVGAQERMRQIEPDQKLVHLHASENDINREIPAPKHAVSILDLVGRYDFGGEALLAEEFRDQQTLAGFGGLKGLLEFKNRNVRLLVLPAELLVRPQNRRQQMLHTG